MGSQAEYDACDFTGATELASTTHGGAVGQDKADGLSNLYEAKVTSDGTLRFACEVGTHCLNGQKVVVNVAPGPSLTTLPPSPPPVSGSGSGSGGGSCDACCPVRTCDSNDDATKPECADYATCQDPASSPGGVCQAPGKGAVYVYEMDYAYANHHQQHPLAYCHRCWNCCHYYHYPRRQYSCY